MSFATDLQQRRQQLDQLFQRPENRRVRDNGRIAWQFRKLKRDMERLQKLVDHEEQREVAGS